MENKKIRKRFGLADYLEEEKFLEEQHRNGWKMQALKLPFSTYVFESCKPAEYVYQLDFNQKSKEVASYIQLFEDCGWEHFYTFGNWYYFRKLKSDKESENVIFNDGPSRAEMAKKVGRFQAGLLIVLLLPLMYMLMLISATENSNSLIITLILAILGIFIIVNAGIQLRNVWKLNKIIQKEKNL